MRARRGAAAQPGEVLAVLRRNPAFARMYAAQLVSFCGDWFATVALQALVLQLTGRPALAGLMFATQLLPIAVASPFAGVVVDRVDRRVVMVAADVVRAVLALGLLLARSDATLWIAFACTAAMSTLSAFFDPASSAALPNVVRDEDLPIANVLMGSAWGTMLAVGAALGGVVAATLGRDAAFIGDAASFGLSAVLLATIRVPFQATARGRAPITVAADIRETWRFARGEPRVASLLLVKAGFGLAGGVITLIPVLAVQVFRAGDAGIGWLMSARGAGALIGPFLFRRLFGTGDRALFRAIAAAFVLFGLSYAAFGGAPTLVAAAIAVFCAHLGGGAQWTLSSLGLQVFTPDRIRGRIFGVDYGAITTTMALSLAATGWAADRFDPRAVALGLAAVALAWAAAWTLLTRRHWPVRHPVARGPD